MSNQSTSNPLKAGSRVSLKPAKPGFRQTSGPPLLGNNGLPEQAVSSQPDQNTRFNTRYGSPWVPSRSLPPTILTGLTAAVRGLNARVAPIAINSKPTNTPSTGVPKNVLSVSVAQSPIAVQNKTVSEITVTFQRKPSDTAFDHVNIWVVGYNGNKNPVEYANASDSPANFFLESNGETVTVYVQASSAAGVTSAAVTSCPSAVTTLSGVVTNPPAPSITQSLLGTELGYQFTFDQVQLSAGTEDVIKSYKVYRNTTGSTFAGASLLKTFADDGLNDGSSIVVQDRVGAGHTYYYFVTSTNTRGLESAATAAQSGAVVSGVIKSSSQPQVTNVPVTTSSGAILSQSGTSKTINVAAFTVQYGFGQVSYNSGSVTPAAYGGWFIYFSDPNYLGGTVTYLSSSSGFVTNAADGQYLIGAITTSSGGGGQGGGGGGGFGICFTPETLVRTQQGPARFDALKVGDLVLTAKRTWKPIFGITSRDYDGEILAREDFGVTPNHPLLSCGKWLPANEVVCGGIREYRGKVMNLILRSEETPEQMQSPMTEHSYTLANGIVAHNQTLNC